MAEYTLKGLIDDRQQLTVYCHNRGRYGEPCYHSAHVNLAKAVETYGPDLTLSAYLRRSRCTKCGKPPTSTTISPIDTGAGTRMVKP